MRKEVLDSRQFQLRTRIVVLCTFGFLLENCVGQIRRADSSIVTPSKYKLTIPNGWVKANGPQANVICSVPLDQCQTGTGGMPNPRAAQIHVSEFVGKGDSANSEATNILSREHIGKTDRNWFVRTGVAERTPVRTIGWEFPSVRFDHGPRLITKLHYIFVNGVVVKVFLEYWANDPDAPRYERDCEDILKSLIRQ